MPTAAIKPTHPAFAAYYQALKAYEGQQVGHETAVRSAFQNLLAETGKLHKWVLVPELALKVKGKLVRPDGTLRDEEWRLPRGFWEAKDTADDLDAEIRKKVAKGYPLLNTIFEDTRQGVLFQNGQEVLRGDLTDRQALADLLNQFYDHEAPDIEGFEQAVTEFRDRIPDLAGGLLAKITLAHKGNAKFRDAFESLMDLCRSSLNPNIREAAVDEMLVQHLLTERIFSKVFEDQDFVRRNVIAVEIERVIDALVSRNFNRAEFLKSLDPFYKAIEDAARTIDDFAEKQHFLNTVYERFFQGYSVEVADTHGIVYTPQQIVDFMCASVEEVLKSEFGLTLGSPEVNILDPCTGTGNFIVNLLRRVPKKDLSCVYKEQLFANEVMLMPYYIAAQNIEHEYYDLTGTYEPFNGLCFVDTLDLAEAELRGLDFWTEANTARVRRQREAQINVVIGNPPYNVGQINENDNNKNRTYEFVDRRVRETYTADSRASNKNSLSDMFVKFFLWATERLEDRDGIVAFVSNNSFVHSLSFDGMRKNLGQKFDAIYHLDTRGNGRLIGVRRTLDGRNIFEDEVRVGVGITLLIRHRAKKSDGGCVIHYHAVGDRMKTREKLAYLGKFESVADVPWTELIPDTRHNWIVPSGVQEFAGFISIGGKGDNVGRNSREVSIFSRISVGLKTNRDQVVYDFNHERLLTKLHDFAEVYNYEVYRYQKHGAGLPVDEFVSYKKIAWSRDLKLDLKRGNQLEFNDAKVRVVAYRPFTKKFVFFDRIANEEVYALPKIFPNAGTESENRMIVVSDIGFRSPFFNALMCDRIADLHLAAASDSHQCLPFFIYDEDGTNRRENITDWALDQFRAHYKDAEISKWDIFHYVYGVLHQPSYREKFADNLKLELPRIPFLADFRAVAEAGRRLAALHVGYEDVEPWPLEWVYAEGVPLSYRVEKMKLSKDKTTLVVNETLTLAGIPPEASAYRLGNRSALEWVVDQYRVSTDKRSGIVTDPNRADDPEYIVHLVEKVVRVSVETVRIVSELPS